MCKRCLHLMCTLNTVLRGIILGCFSQIHPILYVKLQWNCYSALKVAQTNIGVRHKRYYNRLGWKCLETMAKWIVSPYWYYYYTNFVFSVTHFNIWRLLCIHIGYLRRNYITRKTTEFVVYMLRSKIKKAHWVEKTTTTRCGIREMATPRNCVLWLFVNNHNSWHERESHNAKCLLNELFIS